MVSRFKQVRPYSTYQHDTDTTKHTHVVYIHVWYTTQASILSQYPYTIYPKKATNFTFTKSYYKPSNSYRYYLPCPIYCIGFLHIIAPYFGWHLWIIRWLVVFSVYALRTMNIPKKTTCTAIRDAWVGSEKIDWIYRGRHSTCEKQVAGRCSLLSIWSRQAYPVSK